MWFSPCLCWRTSRLVVEPKKRAAVKPARPASKDKCFEARTTKKNLVTEEELSENVGQKNVSPVSPQLQCCETFQPGSYVPSPTKPVRHDTPENTAQLVRACSSGIIDGNEIMDKQVQMAAEAPRATIKDSEKTSPDDRVRIASHESTMAEEFTHSGGDGRSCSQEKEPLRDTEDIPQSVARVPLTSKTASHPIVETTWPTVEQEGAFDAEEEGAPAAEDKAGQSVQVKGTDALLDVVFQGKFGPQNATAPSPGKSERESQQQVVDYHAEPHPPSPKEKMGSSRQTKSGPHCEQESVHLKSEKARPPVTQNNIAATGNPRKEDARSEEVGGVSQVSQNTPSTATTRGRRSTKRKKSSKAKGKRRYGRTGRR